MKLIARLLLCSMLAAPAALASNHDDLAFAVQESHGSKARGWTIERLVTLELGPKCWAKVLEKKSRAIDMLATAALNIERYAKTITGDDWSHVEGQSANSKEGNRAIVDKMITDFKPKFHLTATVEGDDCEATGNGLWLKYIGEAMRSVVRYPPKAGKANVTIRATPNVKALTATVAADGSTVTITGPRDIEPVGWADTISRSLKRVSSAN